jgi:hypothetical protein
LKATFVYFCASGAPYFALSYVLRYIGDVQQSAHNDSILGEAEGNAGIWRIGFGG